MNLFHVYLYLPLKDFFIEKKSAYLLRVKEVFSAWVWSVATFFFPLSLSLSLSDLDSRKKMSSNEETMEDMNGDSFQKVKQRFKDRTMVFNGG